MYQNGLEKRRNQMFLLEKILFLFKGINYLLNLYSALFVFTIIYRGETKQGLMTIGSSNGKYSDENAKDLFEYIVHKNEEIYYIIDKDSPDYLEINRIGKVLNRFSFKANLAVLRSEVMIYDTSYIDLIRCDAKHLQHVNKINIFHGIMGLKKKTDEDLQKRVLNDDYIIATSEYEKKIKENWGFSSENIFLTGLPRYDKLLKRSQSEKEQDLIFFMPTWRPWFKRGFIDPSPENVEKFRSSAYYQTIYQLMTSKELNNYLASKDYTLEIYIHKLMHRYLKNMKVSNDLTNIKLLSADTNVQDKIIQSKMLITDYSSVFFDFTYLNKDVIFYQFDRAKFYEETPGAYISDDEIDSLIVEDDHQLFLTIKNRVEDNFEPYNEQLRQLSNKYIKYDDRNNRDRLYKKIKELTKN